MDRSEVQNVRIDLGELPCWGEIQKKMAEGEKSGSIARWLQEQGHFKGANRDSIRRAVARAREVIGAGESKYEQKDAERKLLELQGKVKDTEDADEGAKETVYIDVLKEAGDLFTLQMDRARMGRQLENSLKFMVKSLTSDVAEAREVLKFVFEIQQELGLTKRPNLPQSDGPRRLFDGMGFDARKRVLEAIDMVRAKVKRLELEDRMVRQAVDETVIEVTAKEVEAPKAKTEGLPFE